MLWKYYKVTKVSLILSITDLVYLQAGDVLIPKDMPWRNVGNLYDVITTEYELNESAKISTQLLT